MLNRSLQFTVLLFLLIAAAGITYGQPETVPDASSRTGRGNRGDRPFGLDEMLAKQRAERDKRDHKQMLERGEEALQLANQLEASFTQNNGFSKQDKARLESLERVVMKIRDELGGDDDEADRKAIESETESKPSSMEEAFKYLKTTTVKLVDELKKTTRFSISAVAIQSSNAVLKVVKFLRLRK